MKKYFKLFGRTIFESGTDEAEKRNFTNDLEQVLYDMMTGGLSANVTEETSLSFSAVWSCVRVLSESVSILPLNIMYRDENDNRIPANEHDLYNVIRKQPNKMMTSYTWRSVVMTHLCLYGNSYNRIIRNRATNAVTQLIPLDPKKAKVFTYDGVLMYEFEGIKGLLTSDDVLHIKGLTIDGIQGKSPIAVARENIQLGMAAQTFGKKFFENGAKPSGAFSTISTLNDEQFRRLREMIDQMHVGTSNTGRPLLLEGGMKFEPITIPPEDAQFLQTRKFSIEEIARLYRVPLHMIGSLDRSTNNNIEMQDTEFWRDAVTPYCKNIEEELNLKLLKPAEQDKYYFNLNLKGMLRGDMQSRATFYQMLFNAGALSPNDILKLEDMNGYEGGDNKYLQLNLAPVQSLEKYMENGKN